MNLLFILASLSAVAVAVLGGAIVSEDFINKNVIVNVIFYRMLPTHHVVTVYMVTSEETMVNQDQRCAMEFLPYILYDILKYIPLLDMLSNLLTGT